MNAMQSALVKAGLVTDVPKERKRKSREYRCRKCGNPMVRIEGTNVMACSSCKNFFIFDNAR
jgi:ribosomal protein L37AE/L43A